jgi:hypothetical protein
MRRVYTYLLGIGLFLGLCQSSRAYAGISYQEIHRDESSTFIDGSVIKDASSAIILLDLIINFGKKIWTVIEANHAVVNLTMDRANALPEGMGAWEQMQDWKTPNSRLFRVTYSNFFGMKVVDFTYRLIFTSGGTVRGKGQYLTQIGVVPAELVVRSGYNFNVRVSVPGVTNAGTAQAPLAAAEIQVSWTLESTDKHVEGSQSYYVRGDGYFEDMSGKLDSSRTPVNASPKSDSSSYDSSDSTDNLDSETYPLQLRIN